jgi:hypothetical protein
MRSPLAGHEGSIMNRNRLIAGAAALACTLASSFLPAQAGEADYRFELVGTPQKDIV